ncbi:MAG: site-2 protease family protein [Candidatus Muiribacteriota bacterium]
MNKKLIYIGIFILFLYIVNMYLQTGAGGLINLLTQRGILIILLLASLVIHEISHGYIAHKLGDPTPKQEKRLSLNPLNHIDPIGFLMFIIVGIGWAKPVRINPFYFENPKKAQTIIAAAGPVSNFILALITLHFLRFITPDTLIYQIVTLFAQINIILGLFNLVPILPLDGGRILYGFLPDHIGRKFSDIEPYGIFIILILVFFFNFGTVILRLSHIILNFLRGILI